MHQFRDRHDGRMLHLGRSYWLRDQFVAAGPVLFAPLDPSIYSAAEAYGRRVNGLATCHRKRGAADPWNILMDDDSASAVEIELLASGGRRMDTSNTMSKGLNKPCL